MRSNNLTEMFPDYKATKTYAGAAKRLAPIVEAWPHLVHVIVQRADGLWIPIVILHHDDTEVQPMSIIHHNCCVTTARKP